MRAAGSSPFEKFWAQTSTLPLTDIRYRFPLIKTTVKVISLFNSPVRFLAEQNHLRVLRCLDQRAQLEYTKTLLDMHS